MSQITGYIIGNAPNVPNTNVKWEEWSPIYTDAYWVMCDDLNKALKLNLSIPVIVHVDNVSNLDRAPQKAGSMVMTCKFEVVSSSSSSSPSSSLFTASYKKHGHMSITKTNPAHMDKLLDELARDIVAGCINAANAAKAIEENKIVEDRIKQGKVTPPSAVLERFGVKLFERPDTSHIIVVYDDSVHVPGGANVATIGTSSVIMVNRQSLQNQLLLHPNALRVVVVNSSVPYAGPLLDLPFSKLVLHYINGSQVAEFTERYKYSRTDTFSDNWNISAKYTKIMELVNRNTNNQRVYCTAEPAIGTKPADSLKSMMNTVSALNLGQAVPNAIPQ